MLYRFLPLFFVALTFVGLVLGRDLLHRRRYGSSGMMHLRQRSELWKDLRTVLLKDVLMFVHALLFAVAPGLLAPFALPGLAGSAAVFRAGVLLAVVGVLLTTWAQLQMGASWRFGIETSARPGLITTGLFRYSRNPIYVFLILICVGVMLMMPTWFSLVIVLVTVGGLRFAVKLEEAYLLKTYGEEFHQYARQVGRFLPGIGRLS
jgi:protein-S-isoprenylcysteine O-methyltransferase Ste14